MPPGSYFIVMTHQHPLLALCEAMLKREDAGYVGMIDSHYRLEGRNIRRRQLDTLRCPLGLRDVQGKLPAEIAVAVVTEIIASNHASALNRA